MVKKQILYIVAYYSLIFLGVQIFWWLQSEESHLGWNFFANRLFLSALMSFFIVFSLTLFDRLYYNSQTMKKKFVLAEGEQILGEYKALQMRGFMPVLGKLILTSERLFFSVKGKGFSIHYTELAKNTYSELFAWFSSDTILTCELHSESEHREHFIIESWDNFKTQFETLVSLKKQPFFVKLISYWWA